MKEDLLDILCCPICKGDVQLAVVRKEGDEVIDGTLRCTKCGTTYPIEDGIPNLLPPDERG